MLKHLIIILKVILKLSAALVIFLIFSCGEKTKDPDPTKINAVWDQFNWDEADWQ